MALCSKEYEENFQLIHIMVNDKYYPINDPKRQFWKCGFEPNINFPTYSSVSFKFEASEYGTYNQDFIFRDFSSNYFRTRITVDYICQEDEKRMEAAYNYLKHQLYLISYTQEPLYWHSIPDSHNRLLESTYPRLTKDSVLSYDLVAAEQLNTKNYCNVMKQLIGLEEICRLAHISKFNCTKRVKLLNTYRLGSTDGSSVITKYAPEGQFLILLQLDQDGTEDSAAGKLLLQSCDEVNVTIFPLEVTFRLHIEDRSHNFIGMRLFGEILQYDWPGNKKLQVGTELDMRFTFMQNRIPFCQWQLAVDLLPDVKFIFPPSIDSMENIPIEPISTGDENLNEILNYKQRLAVTMMMEPRRDYKPPLLIVGAFGTGKTFTIAHGIKRILETQADAKILLCTHSNSAADLYVKEYFDRWYTATGNDCFKPLRIYYPERVRSTVSLEVQKYCQFTYDWKFFRYPFDEDLRKYKIIITTLVTSFSLLNLNLKPTHIIIDEAAQAFECEAIIPLTKATKRTQLILAGDNLQMRPEVYSHLAKLRKFGISLLERLDNVYDFNNRNKIILRINYRSHPKIVDVMTSCLYGKRLFKNDNRKHLELGFFHFVNVCGTDEKAHHSTGYKNTAEVNEIVNLVKQMKNCWQSEELGKYEEGSIGVLSCYTEQILAIRTAMRKAGMHEVSVERIQNVQGKQFPIVIISTVITNRNNRLGALLNVRHYGFLTDVGLLNTAITRAKNIVAVVGDLLALITMGTCQNIWRYMLNSTDRINGITHEQLFKEAESIKPLKTTPLNPEANPFFPNIEKNKNDKGNDSMAYLPIFLPEYVPLTQQFRSQMSNKKKEKTD